MGAEAEVPPGNVCPVCRSDSGCPHLLLVLDIESQDAIDGALLEELHHLKATFADLFAEVAARQAICGHGLVREATRAYFMGYGEIAGTTQLHAELGRDYDREYLIDILDCAPNISRSKLEDTDNCGEYIWSETPDEAVALVRNRLQELQRLIELPEKNSEWIPQHLDYY